MAKVTGPLHSSEARGRMGGLVYNTYRGTSTVKASCSPAQPRSTKQLRIRALGMSLSRGWQSLTAVQRTGWNSYAAAHTEVDGMGNPKRMTGANWYIRLNSRLLQLGLTTSPTAPTVVAPSTPATFSAATGSGSCVCTFTSISASDRLWIHDDGPHSVGRHAQLPRATFATAALGTTGTCNSGTLAVGNHDLFARVVSASTGLSSQWVSANVAIT